MPKVFFHSLCNKLFLNRISLGCTFRASFFSFQRFYPNALALIGYVVMPNPNGAERPHH